MACKKFVVWNVSTIWFLFTFCINITYCQYVIKTEDFSVEKIRRFWYTSVQSQSDIVVGLRHNDLNQGLKQSEVLISDFETLKIQSQCKFKL